MQMDNQHYGKLFSFIWNIANDVLVYAFEKGDYKKIILPFTVLRRIDVLLEATKPQVAAKKAFCEKEVKPYDAEATFGEPAIGYEISFTKHFYKPVELRSQDEIAADIAALEKANDGLLKEILG